jgi:hypothetical protein
VLWAAYRKGGKGAHRAPVENAGANRNT